MKKELIAGMLISLTAYGQNAGASLGRPQPWKQKLPETYKTLSAAEKEDFLWDRRIVPSRYRDLPSAAGWTADTLFHGIPAMLVMATLGLTMDHESDEMPVGRPKIIHSQGSVARVELETDPAEASKWGGVLRGASGLARFSLAAPHWAIGSFTPGMALKFFRSGLPSVNLVVMNSTSGQGANTDFFLKPFSHIIPPADLSNPVLAFLEKRFAKVAREGNPNHLHLEHLVTHRTDGTPEPEGKTPYQLIFVPSGQVKGKVPSDSKKDFRENLASLAPGLELYKVQVVGKRGDEPRPLGRLVLKSSPVASWWGDRKLFFRHQR